jgi:hypothetical protein
MRWHEGVAPYMRQTAPCLAFMAHIGPAILVVIFVDDNNIIVLTTMATMPTLLLSIPSALVVVNCCQSCCRCQSPRWHCSTKINALPLL